MGGVCGGGVWGGLWGCGGCEGYKPRSAVDDTNPARTCRAHREL